MEQAALRTRQAKRPAQRAALFDAWKQEARTLGFDLAKARLKAARVPAQAQQTNTAARAAPVPSADRVLASAQRMLGLIAGASSTPSGGAGLQARLRENAKADDRDRSRERD